MKIKSSKTFLRNPFQKYTLNCEIVKIQHLFVHGGGEFIQIPCYKAVSVGSLLACGTVFMLNILFIPWHMARASSSCVFEGERVYMFPELLGGRKNIL